MAEVGGETLQQASHEDQWGPTVSWRREHWGPRCVDVGVGVGEGVVKLPSVSVSPSFIFLSETGLIKNSCYF